MMGAILSSGSAEVGTGAASVSMPLSAAAMSKLNNGGSLLVSFVNTDNQVQAFDIPVTAATGTVGGTVPATLSLTLGPPASFGAFTPGAAQTYTASTTATVVSTAGDAALTVTDPSATHTGHLVNGAFALPQPLLGLGTVKTYAAPVSNDQVTVQFRQPIASTDALRTGAYSKMLTFTLSTTNP
jgi:hypothetical protein